MSVNTWLKNVAEWRWMIISLEGKVCGSYFESVLMEVRQRVVLIRS